MILYIDNQNKRLFISAPKCGNQTLASYLNIHLQTKYSNELIKSILTDNNFQKIIIIRDIYDRFVSGFYEDLKNNKCYDNLNISFYEYCKFLKYIFDNKIKNVTNLNIYFKNMDLNINWGNCSKLTLPITDSNGKITGHIISLRDSIKGFEQNIEGDNVKVIDIKELSNYLLGFDKKMNCKITNLDNISDYNTHLSELRKLIHNSKGYPQLDNMLNKEIKEIIMHIYNSDLEYIDYLINKYN